MSNQKLVDILKQLHKTYPLTAYNWDLPKNCPIEIPSHVCSGYEKNIYLKENFHKSIKTDFCMISHYWIVQDWGRIGSFKKNQKNDLRIIKFQEELGKKNLTKNSFDCISSLSKIASFIQPETFAIYDSRAIYSLNWLLYNFSEFDKLFPQPAGRSSDLAKYDIQTIFRLANRPVLYRSNNFAYHDYCKLMQELSEQVFGPDSKPYKMEMLLFMIAPTWVVDDINKSVSMTIIRDNF